MFHVAAIVRNGDREKYANGMSERVAHLS